VTTDKLFYTHVKNLDRDGNGCLSRWISQSGMIGTLCKNTSSGNAESNNYGRHLHEQDRKWDDSLELHIDGVDSVVNELRMSCNNQYRCGDAGQLMEDIAVACFPYMSFA
jgi:hypothetical protein